MRCQLNLEPYSWAARYRVLPEAAGRACPCYRTMPPRCPIRPALRSAGTFARVPNLVLNGTVIKPGAENLQDTFESCAASCTSTGPDCNGFLFCSQVGGLRACVLAS